MGNHPSSSAVKPSLKGFDRLSFFMVTVGYSGLFPFASGTIGSFATIPLLVLLDFWKISPAFIFILSWFSALPISLLVHRLEKAHKVNDPSWVVIDELLGMLITWALTPNIQDPLVRYGLIFFVFRFFDIVKVWPANVIDRRLKNGLGTLLDDLVSGIYAGFFLRCLTFFIPLS